MHPWSQQVSYELSLTDTISTLYWNWTKCTENYFWNFSCLCHPHLCKTTKKRELRGSIWLCKALAYKKLFHLFNSSGTLSSQLVPSQFHSIVKLFHKKGQIVPQYSQIVWLINSSFISQVSLRHGKFTFKYKLHICMYLFQLK